MKEEWKNDPEEAELEDRCALADMEDDDVVEFLLSMRRERSWSELQDCCQSLRRSRGPKNAVRLLAQALWEFEGPGTEEPELSDEELYRRMVLEETREPEIERFAPWISLQDEDLPGCLAQEFEKGKDSRFERACGFVLQSRADNAADILAETLRILRERRLPAGTPSA